MAENNTPEPTLRSGTLGTGDIAFFVVSAAAPLTIMAGIAPFAILSGGIGAPAGYLFAGLVLAVFAVGFTTMSRHVGNGGAFYAYITKGLGRTAGVASAVLALFAYNACQIGMYGLLATSAHDTVQMLWGIDVPWPVYALAGVALVWFAGYRSIDFGAKVLGVLLVAETGILLVLAVAVLLKGGAHGLDLQPFAPAHAFSPGTGALLAFAFGAFIGFESTAIYRSEARDPKRTIPRATYIAVGFLAVFYAFVCWVIIEAFGAGQVVEAITADPTSLFFTAAHDYVGAWAADAMHILIVSSVFAALLAFHNAINRYTHALATEGVLPARLGRIHPRHGSPHTAGLLQTALSAVVIGAFAAAGADPYLQLLIWVNTPGVIGIVLLQALAALAVPFFFRRISHREGALRTVVAPVASVLLMAGALYLVISKIALLTGASASVNTLLIVLVPVVLAAGAVLGRWLRAARPEVYARLAADPEEAAGRPDRPAEAATV
ncbi:APC family permease [Kitasatospora saccharophila]|uniref:APC family permease n=1 Tax=Kitasatospora saccharophila TaxID=407973 RepID=A0ABN2Y1N5_9ACTN